ncbi:MAG: glycosyltransferase family 1 protein, partial [Chloroflexi bacterium]|nr:glycosyltransferase family 1 protein [Chloroflexota bacterium]
MAQNVLFLTRYTALAASTRQRVLQYLDAVRAAGFVPAVQPLFSDQYLRQTFARKDRWRSGAEVLRAWWRRWWCMTRKAAHYDLVFVQYEVLPYLPLWFSRSLLRASVKLITDYDDAIHLNYEQHSNPSVRRMLRGNIPMLIAHSRQVIVGNRYLAHWARQFNERVTLIPTSVDTSKYPVVEHRIHQPITIGWIGTPHTAEYLRMLEGPLRELRKRHNFTLKVIGAPNFKLNDVDVYAREWDESREYADLCSFDVGIMPVRDDAWGRGKSAFKLIQYLA